MHAELCPSLHCPFVRSSVGLLWSERLLPQISNILAKIPIITSLLEQEDEKEVSSKSLIHALLENCLMSFCLAPQKYLFLKKSITMKVNNFEIENGLKVEKVSYI